MKKILTLLLTGLFLFSCSIKKEGNMVVSGKIKGLKKGKLYLQKMKDTVLVSVDSIILNGSNEFVLTDDVDSPEVYYLTFDGNTTAKRILFFGDKGNIAVNDNIELFGLAPEISGSKNQELLDEYTQVAKKFQEKRLEFVEKDFKAKQDKNEELIQQLDEEFQNLMKRRVLYTTNFAVSNADYEVAPYLGLTELYDASIQILDTLNASLTPKIKASKYGKRFQEYINKVKENEN